MPSLYLVQPKSSGGGQIAAADLNQLVNTLTGNQNTPVNVRNTDPIAYTFQGQNTDAAGKTLLLYGPDGTTVILRSQGNGVVASPDGTAAAPIVTTTHTQTLTGKTFTAPHMTSAVVDSGGLTISGGVPALAFGGANPVITGGTAALYFQNQANSAANMHIPDGGGLVLDRGNISLTGSGSIVSPQISGATPVAAGGQLGLGATFDAKGAGAAATLGTIGGSGPATAVQNAWLRISVGGVNCWLPYWS